MNDLDRNNTREPVTRATVRLPKLLAALVVLVFVSVVSVSLAGAVSHAPQTVIRQTTESEDEVVSRPAPDTAGIAPPDEDEHA